MPKRTERETIVEALRACRLWRAASDGAVEALARRASLRHLSTDSLVVSEGEPADSFGVVASGTVRVHHLSAAGRRRTLETAGPGDPVAAVAALAGGRYPATIDAAEDAAVVWLPREALLGLVAAEPAVARDVVGDLAGRVVRLTALVQSLSLDVPARLARHLFEAALESGRRTPEGLEIRLGTTKTSLAEALGTVPETLSRAFAKLHAEGLLTVRGRTIVVHDVGALARRGAGYSER